MGTYDIASAKASDLTNAMTDFSVSPETTDGSEGQQETRWTNQKWTDYFGYYKKIPELKAAIDTMATWTVGKGFTADEDTTILLDPITGWGKDTFNTILENMLRTMEIGGDAFAEIILDKEDNLINLKPLDPSSIVIITNPKGIITRYEQTSKAKTPNKTFKPEQIFHLARNRVADEIHGQSVIEAVEEIILMRNEAMADYRIVMHRHVKPLVKFILDTDDTAKIDTFKTKADSAIATGENLYLPKDSVGHEIIAIPPNATLNPLAWIESLNDYFYEAVGTPKVIIGNSKNFTEASAKIVYLTFQQRVEGKQLYIEEEVLGQLNLEIQLTFPASLENEALSDKPKEQEEQVNEPEIQTGEQAVEPNDQVVEQEGRK